MAPDTLDPLEIAERGPLTKIGKTIRFARRIHGWAIDYYFFASRIRLPADEIKLLRNWCQAFIPCTRFEPPADYPLRLKDEALLVPVLDPLTVALHLHACYLAAWNELLGYTTGYEEQDPAERKTTHRRQRKRLLAELVQALIDAEGDLGGGLVSQLENKQHVMEPTREGESLPKIHHRLKFLIAHDEQVAHRTRWRETWARLLTEWLTGFAMKSAKRTYERNLVEDFHHYTIVHCRCMERLNESPQGRAFLDTLYDDRDHWIHQVITPREAPKGDWFQVVRKTGTYAFESLYQFFPKLAKMGQTWAFILYFNNLASAKALDFADFASHGIVYTAIKGKFNVPYTKMKILAPDAPAGMGMTRLLAYVELINMCLGGLAVFDALSNEDVSDGDRALAIMNFIGGILDTTTAFGGEALTKTIGKRWVKVLGAVSGILDVILATTSSIQAYEMGDTGRAVGYGVVAGGSVLTTGAAVAGWLEWEAVGSALGWVGLGIVALGYGIGAIWGDHHTPFEKLLLHCEWGKEAGKGNEHPDWSPSSFKEWKGNIDFQLDAALALLCSFSIASNDESDPREARVQLTWMPAGAKLVMTYHEEWEPPGYSPIWANTFRFEDETPEAKTGDLTIRPLGDNAYAVRPLRLASERPAREYPLGTPGRKSLGLRQIWIDAWIELEGASTQFRIPSHRKPIVLFD
jgi:hypothetical protein